MDGLELACRFSYITNQLRYCGPAGASSEFLKLIAGRHNDDLVRDALTKFEALNPYLSAIAKKHGLDMYSHEVVEAYWIGNKLLDAFTDDDMKEIIRNLMARGLPQSMGERLISSLPPGFVPHHDFNVLYVGVGSTTGSVPTTLANMDNCRVGWGKVTDVLSDKLLVSARGLQFHEGKYSLGDEEPRIAIYIPEMLPEVSPGDTVALHWGFAPAILTTEQLRNLEKYSERVRAVCSRALAEKISDENSPKLPGTASTPPRPRPRQSSRRQNHPG